MLQFTCGRADLECGVWNHRDRHTHLICDQRGKNMNNLLSNLNHHLDAPHLDENATWYLKRMAA